MRGRPTYNPVFKTVVYPNKVFNKLNPQNIIAIFLQ